jgi:hypothetical protein
MMVTYTGELLCPVRRLHELLADAAVTGQPIRQYLCRPLSADRTTFLEQPLTVAAFEEDVAAHFEAAGVEYHATLHGSRRGSLQAGAAQGMSLAEIGRMGQIKTPRVQVMYVAADRHLPGLLPRGGRPSKKPKLGHFMQGHGQ